MIASRRLASRRKSSIDANVPAGAASGQIDGRHPVAGGVVRHEEGVEQLRLAPELHALDGAHQTPSNTAPRSKR